MSVEPPDFRHVLGHFATGVTIITTLDADGRAAGLTANAFSAVSLDPPLVLVCVDRASETHDLIARRGCFAVNVLASGQQDVARRFADDARERRFESLDWAAAQTGAPVLAGVLAWVDCRLHATADGGDHTIFIGEVVAAAASAGRPLLFYRGAYGIDD